MNEMTGWERRTLTDLARYLNGFAFKPEDWEEDGLPIIRIEQLKNPASVVDYYSRNLPEENIIDDGDLIFSWSASLFLKIWQHGKAALNQHLFKVVEKDGIDRKFLKSFIEFYLPEIIKASHGSTMQHITRKELDRFGAPFPVDNQEQTQIAIILSTIDKAIAQTEAIIAKQQRIKTGLMQDLLTRGIDEHGAIRTEATHAFKDSPLGRIPTEWEVETIGNVLSRPPKNGYSPQEAEGYTGIRMLGLGCLTIRGFEPVQLKNAPADDPRVSQAILRNGDFLISRSNTRDLVGLVGVYQDIGEPCMYSDLMVRLCFDQTVNTQYMEYVFRGYVIRSQLTNAATGTSSSMVKINATIIKNCVFAKPKFNEQGQILEILRKQADSLRKESACLANLRAVKTGLMQDMLTGKVRVTELIKSSPTLTNPRVGA